MNKIAVISDIHGNVPALEAVLLDIKSRGITTILCLGDLVGKGPNPAEALDITRMNCQIVVKGNWDYLITDHHSEMLLWHQQQLGPERIGYLKSLPIYHDITMGGRLIRLCHASPHDVFHRTYLHTKRIERLKLFEPPLGSHQEADVIGYGDIHGAHVDHFRGKTIFNTGSVGNPLDIPQASYVILEGQKNSPDPGPFLITIARIPYDIERAVTLAMESDMPDKDAYIQELRTAIYRNS